MVSPNLSAFPQIQYNPAGQFPVQETKTEAPLVKQEVPANVLQPNFGFNQMSFMPQNMFFKKQQFMQN